MSRIIGGFLRISNLFRMSWLWRRIRWGSRALPPAPQVEAAPIVLERRSPCYHFHKRVTTAVLRKRVLVMSSHLSRLVEDYIDRCNRLLFLVGGDVLVVNRLIRSCVGGSWVIVRVKPLDDDRVVKTLRRSWRKIFRGRELQVRDMLCLKVIKPCPLVEEGAVHLTLLRRNDEEGWRRIW
ncbi:hypothetical protein TorRG33x02_269890 [Trema orientale]|uniref:Uncharacterized protein n=1 Tax=Trema orientale TaxID=63057 RepID=A0A2P5CXN9_TREOI|nr:hypothetical protein TorRG33x02_269890 [Trema orientale]